MGKLKHVLTHPGEYRKLYSAGAVFLALLLSVFAGPESTALNLLLTLLGGTGLVSVERLPNDTYSR